MQLVDIPVLVTGGASGLGAAAARRLAQAGARVAVLDIQLDAAQSLAQAIGGLAVHCDVTRTESLEAALLHAEAAHGPARLLVNCAGGGAPARIVGKDGPMPMEAFRRILELNLIGAFNATRLAAAKMMTLDPLADGERGAIVFTTSAAAYEAQVGQAAYAAAKGGLTSLTLQMAREFAPFGIRAMAIAPGIFDTPLLQTASEAVRASLAAAIPFPSRLGQPDEFAEQVVNIARCAYLNGETIRLDGAIRLAPR